MDKYVANRRLSQLPFANLASEFAVNGAIRKTSAQIPYSTWFVQTPVFLSQNSIPTGFSESVAKTRGLIKSEEAGVKIHLTFAPDFFNKRTRNAIL